MAEQERRVRCAIYTRKSTEEGLQQDFNSLDAQRESAESYILSQRQAGWAAVDSRYDDGGFSGASLERPALRKLLADVEARRIDCVIVYKVDRLSRSLLDFARLVELFDRFGVSFVSVTQEFNTTTSLGRLTLNILLSFAQFEREIIGERTRDKMGAARRKGKWIGGSPVLGYDVDPKGGKLLVNEAEAERVRAIYRIASEAGSINETLKKVNACGFVTKTWRSAHGIDHQGRAFERATLRRLLGNVLYTGAVSYKGTVYAGEHAGIVEQDLWRTVNDQLRGDQKKRAVVPPAHGKQHALLGKLLCCASCHGPMRPTHTSKRGERFEYYACAVARRTKGEACAQQPVAIADFDASLVRHLEPTLGNELSGPILQEAIERVIYDSLTRQVVVMRRDETRSVYLLPVPFRRGVRSARAEDRGRIPRISRLMALAIRIERLVEEQSVGTFGNLADLGHISRPRMSQIASLVSLAPAIQEELLFLPKILAGRDWVNERALRSIARIVDWDHQIQAFRSLMNTPAGGRRS